MPFSDVLTPARLAELTQIAEAATPGPWAAYQPAKVNWHIRNSEGVFVLEQRNHGAPARDARDAAFIAAFHPQTALALLARVAALEAEIVAIATARQKIHDSFRTRTSDDTCQCPYCRRDADALAELAAEYELDRHQAMTRAEQAERQRDTLTAAVRDLMADYEQLLGDGVTDATEPAVLTRVKAVLAHSGHAQTRDPQ